MYLTLEIMKASKCCSAGIKWFERYFPNGCELVDVINHKYVPIDFIQWGYNRKHLYDLSEEEIQACLNKLKIQCDNPNTIYSSYDVKNCSNIQLSNHIENCNYIVSSNNVINSNIIQGSSNINYSTKIFNSLDISNSQKIFISKNISQSKNIAYSNNVIDSKNVLYGNTITDSSYIIGTEENINTNIMNSFFIYNCNNISNCLFCANINNKEFLLFNTPISENEFNKYKQELQQILKNITFEFVENWGSGHFPLSCPNLKNQKFFNKNLPQEFIQWIKTLPYYNEVIFNQIIS